MTSRKLFGDFLETFCLVVVVVVVNGGEMERKKFPKQVSETSLRKVFLRDWGNKVSGNGGIYI